MKTSPGGLHVSVGSIFTFGSDILAAGRVVVWCRGLRVPWLGPGCLVGPVSGHAFAWSWLAVLVVPGRGAAWSGWWRVRAARRRGRRGSCGAVCGFSGAGPAAARRWFSSCRVFQAARMRWLRTMSRVVVNSIRGARPIRRHQPRADVVGGGVLGGGEAAFGAGAAGVGAAPGRGRVVVFLRGLGEHVRRDGDRLLGAAGLGMFGGLQDLRAVPVQRHRRGAERAADLAHGGGALDAVVAVLVVGGEAAELVAGQFGGLAVVVRGLFPGGGAGERPEFQQRARCLRGSTGCRWR